MGKSKKQVSPAEYIKTRARKPPVYKCLVTKEWEPERLANIAVVRRHDNGNFTAGFYLVDLQCLGIKDTHYIFNTPKENLDELLETYFMDVDEVDYALAHNIIYAAHDFAMDFDIHPHPDFQVTRYILEEDNDSVPLIEIAVGDNEGKPHLIVDSTFKYKAVIDKLEKLAGPGNYTVSLENEEEYDDQLDADTDDEFTNEDEKLNFNDVAEMDDDELNEHIERSGSFQHFYLLDSEQLFRALDDKQPGTIMSRETLETTDDYIGYEEGLKAWDISYERSRPKIDEILPDLQQVIGDGFQMDDDKKLIRLLGLHQQCRDYPEAAFAVFSSISLTVLVKNLPMLLEKMEDYIPAVQLMIACMAQYSNVEDEKVQFLASEPHVNAAFKNGQPLHAFHYHLFWLFKAFHALKVNNLDQLIYYHNFVRIGGAPGSLKFLYAMELCKRLASELKVEGYE